mgnify:CR=1 FL=1
MLCGSWATTTVDSFLLTDAELPERKSKGQAPKSTFVSLGSRAVFEVLNSLVV